MYSVPHIHRVSHARTTLNQGHGVSWDATREVQRKICVATWVTPYCVEFPATPSGHLAVHVRDCSCIPFHMQPVDPQKLGENMEEIWQKPITSSPQEEGSYVRLPPLNVVGKLIS